MALFGGFLIFTDFFVPLGVSMVGFPISIVGAVMLVLGFFRKEPLGIEPEPGMKFCWYCMKQIPRDSTECSYCSLPQHDIAN